MSHITHLALKVDNIDSATKLYEGIFGFKYVETIVSKGHISRQLSDGVFSLALMQYESEESPEAMLAGPGSCIHHFGIEVDDLEKYELEIKKLGCQIISGSPLNPPIKFKTPSGIIAELQPTGRFIK
jgi:lactoylglutathione lyase